MIFGMLGPNKLSVIDRCPYYRGVHKEKLDCISINILVTFEFFFHYRDN